MEIHQAVQQHIIDLLPPGEAFLEYPLPGHVADVAWPKMGILFEVQCSPISVKECKKRIDDYKALGYTVIWILHQKRFNRRLPSKTEKFLRLSSPTYFTNITKGGHGYIYDQYESFQGLIRTYRSLPFQINLTIPLSDGKRLFFKNDRHDVPKEKPKRNPFALFDALLLKIIRALNS